MVNTRRMESIGSTSDIRKRHRTRGVVKEEDSGSSSVNETDSEESNAESDISEKHTETVTKKDTQHSSRVRQLRSRFVHERKFDARPLRSSHKLISLNDRHSIAMYSNRNMHDDSDLFNGNDSDEEIYSRSRRRTRMTRIQRRTALSLRPIRQKCYTDPHSPLHFNTDSDGVVGVRRSKRKIKSQFTSTSWLRDDQMHKVGYPNLNAGYSEEDSRDGAESHRDDMQVTRRVSKCSESSEKRRQIKNPKYLFDYQTNEISSRRRKTEKDQRRESHDKENEQENATQANGRLRVKGENNFKDEDGEREIIDQQVDESELNKSDDENIEENVEIVENDNDNPVETKDAESESDDDVPRRRTRTMTNNNRIIKHNYATRETRNRKNTLESSSSETPEGKKYSLRTRAPKPPKNIQNSVLMVERNLLNRRRFNRRRKDSSSSSSSSSSSPDGRRNKPPHTKNERLKSGGGGSSKITPIRPETVDSKVRFNSVGGLDSHIQCLKEMILLPMMYPEVFKQFQMQPPRGVLFHGPPGTGKTLIARALANECSFGTRKVAFFMRKGADLLSKWIGESERQLRMLFEQAAELKPSIIFFDELDGLAPVRSARQDQIHASIVSTLLALMDGLDSRGEVIVIGATNRIDSIDPALRRPGRFDRELFFPLPSRKEREEILNVHVSQWSKAPSSELISYLAETSVGYCGSDLRALCSEAVIMSFRRTYPQVYNSEHRLLLDPENVFVQKVDFMRAKSLLVPASQRVTQDFCRKLLPSLEPLLEKPLGDVLELLKSSFPHGLNPSLAKVKLALNVRPAQLLLTGDGCEHGQSTYLAPAVLYKMEHIHSYLLDLATLFRETGRSPEEACIQVFTEAKRNVPSIIYIPNIDAWWELVTSTVRAILIAQLSLVDPNVPILLLATADSTFENLPEEIKNIFSLYRKEIYEISAPNEECRRSFFKSLIVDGSLRPPRSSRKRPRTPPPLPRAPTPPPAPLSEEQAKKLYETEEHTLRELRIFLRDICKKLANNKLFYMFTKPVDTDEVPDYTTIIKQPMDLETMMTKVDFHRYECAKDFLTDIELICHNALEYNPARTSADKQIRHRACSLRDYAYTLIKNEMDSDFEEKCQDIASKRIERKACVTKYLPAYINTPEDSITTKTEPKPPEVQQIIPEEENEEDKVEDSKINRISPAQRKRKFKFNWRKGMLSKRKRPRLSNSAQDGLDESRDSSQDESKSNSQEQINANDTENISTPLTVNCDTNSLKQNSLHSPKRRLSDLMSPSELLENPLDFDDVDDALNETEGSAILDSANVECCQDDLIKVLNETVSATHNYSLNALLDLYNQLNQIIKRYARTHLRNSLPKELSMELNRFQKEET